MQGVSPEWQLVKAQGLIAQAFASGGAGQVFPHLIERHLVHVVQQRFHLALVGDGGFEPGKLLGA